MTSSIHADMLVGKKLKREQQQSFREHVSAPTSEFAKRQLEKMGWSEGTGLGKKRDGVTSHIRVKRRKDNLGLGGSDKPAVVEALGDSEWWKDSLGSTLAKLGTKKDKKKRKKEKEKTNVKTYTDDELFEATGGARFGMRAGISNNLHKWVRTENVKAGTDAKATAASDSADDTNHHDILSGKQDAAQDSKTSSDKEEISANKSPKNERKKKRKRDNEEDIAIVHDANIDKAADREETKDRKKLAKKERKTKRQKAKE
jgi:Pin2-interacting protein X1